MESLYSKHQRLEKEMKYHAKTTTTDVNVCVNPISPHLVVKKQDWMST